MKRDHCLFSILNFVFINQFNENVPHDIVPLMRDARRDM